MDWQTPETSNEGIKIPGRWLHLHYYDALNTLFRVENALRVFAYVVLKNKFKEEWMQTCIQISESKRSTIAAAVEKRIEQAKGYGYLGYDIASPLVYLNSGELIRLMTDDPYWELFEPYFKGKQHIMRTKLDEIGSLRNALAHFRPLKEEDVELIKQNARHALLGVEECLNEMTQTFAVVPTNTKEEWYRDFSTLASSSISTKIHQGKTERWIAVKISFSAAVLQEQRWGQVFRTYTMLNLISPATIKTFPQIARHCTFVREETYGAMQDDKAAVTKTVSITFRRDALIGSHSAIYEDMKRLVLKIEEEADLLKGDNLARGELVESVSVNASLKSNEHGSWWQFDTGAFKCPFGANDPTEYWGDIGFWGGDFIAGASHYPWMPSSISKDEFGFLA